MALNKKLDYDEIQNSFSRLIIERPAFLSFLKFIAQRKRTSAVSDVSQLISYLNSGEYHVDRNNLMVFLTELTRLGIGIARGSDDDRAKFYWNFWMFPIFNSNQPDKLLGIEFKELSIFTEDKNRLRQVVNQIDRYRLNLMAGMPDGSLKPDIIFAQSNIAKTSLSDSSLDELLAEVERRGWSIKLERLGSSVLKGKIKKGKR